MMLYNLHKIKELSDGDSDFLGTILSVFILETPTEISALKEAIESKNFDQIYGLAHKIKPNLELLGMEKTKNKVLQIETLGKESKNIKKIKELFCAVEKDVCEAIKSLKTDFDL